MVRYANIFAALFGVKTAEGAGRVCTHIAKPIAANAAVVAGSAHTVETAEIAPHATH